MLSTISSFIKNDKGFASAVKGSVILVIGIALFSMIFDVSLGFIRRERVKSAMDFANVSSYKEVDIERLKNGELYLPTDEAEKTFMEFLQENLKLDSNLQPLEESIAVGEVEVLDFQVFNMEDTPTQSPSGADIEEMAVYSQIRIPFNPTFYGVFTDTYYITVSVTTDLPHDNPFELYGLAGGDDDWEPPQSMFETVISQGNTSTSLRSTGQDRGDFVGNSFTAPKNITRFKIETYIGVNGTPEGELEARLYNATGGLPIGNAIASNVITHTSDGWAKFEFIEHLTSGDSYAFAIKPTVSEDTNVFSFWGTSSNTYSGGNMIYTNNGNWNNHNGDLAFYLHNMQYYYQFGEN